MSERTELTHSFTPHSLGNRLDWNKLGLDPTAATVVAPKMPSFNRADHAVRFPVSAAGIPQLPVPAFQGWLLLLQ